MKLKMRICGLKFSVELRLIKRKKFLDSLESACKQFMLADLVTLYNTKDPLLKIQSQISMAIFES